MNVEKYFISFLECLNKADSLESVYNEALKILFNLFSIDKILLIEKQSFGGAFFVEKEIIKSGTHSLIKYNFPDIFENIKENINKINIYKYINVSEKELIDKGIKSFIGVELNSNKKNKILILSSNNKLDVSSQDILLLIDVGVNLNNAFKRIEKVINNSEENNTLKIQNSKLIENENLKTAFINDVVHELKTPLTSILGFSKLLYSKEENENNKILTDQIIHAGNRLNVLIDDFIQVIGFEAGTWITNYEEFNVSELITQATKEFSSLSNRTIKKNIPRDEYKIKSDKKLIRQILDNLISNAIKYSPVSSPVCVELIETGNKFKIIVSDEGFGIEKEEISKIFNRFYRSKNKNLDGISGSGLGLFICKEIVKALNGNIDIESEVGKGSKVIVTLPNLLM